MQIRSARPEELDVVLDLFRAAARWLAERGLDQWQRGPRTERIRRDIEAGTVFVVIDDEDTGEIVGTLTVDTRADPDFWTDADDPSSALYLHRMIVDPRHHGRRIGEAMTAWAEQFAGALGYRWLRLDAWRTNQGLVDYYRSRGWQHIRTVNPPWRESGALFQRPAATSPAAAPGQPQSDQAAHTSSGRIG